MLPPLPPSLPLSHTIQQRRAHYAEQAAKAGITPYPTSGVVAVDPTLSPDQQVLAAAFQLPPPPNPNGEPNEFRERFQRSLVAPAPFRSSYGADGGGGEGSGSASTPTSASGSTSTSGGEPIDPQLAGSVSGIGNGVDAGAIVGVNGTSVTATVTTMKTKTSVSAVKSGFSFPFCFPLAP